MLMPTDDATIVQFDQEYLDHLILSEVMETHALARARESLALVGGRWTLTQLYTNEIQRSGAELKWLRSRIREVKRYYVQDEQDTNVAR